MKSPTNLFLKVLLKTMALLFNKRPSFNQYLKSADGWIDFVIGIRTESRSVENFLVFKDGNVRVVGKSPEKVNVSLIAATDKDIRNLLLAAPTEQIYMLLKNRFRTEGNMSYLNLFFFLTSVLLNKKQIKMMEKEKAAEKRERLNEQPKSCEISNTEMSKRTSIGDGITNTDPGVKHLLKPFLTDFSIDDFPRVKRFLDIHFEVKPEICAERPKLMTDWFRENGFEDDQNGNPWNPAKRQGLAFKHYMENRQPVIRENDLIAGTTTTKETGVVIYPDSHGTMIWGELLTVPHRALNSYDISEETVQALHHDVFPFWLERNFREWVRTEYDSPLCQQLDERFAVYFIWKQAALSHTIADFPKLLSLGIKGFIDEICENLKDETLDQEKKNTLEAMILCLEGVVTYSENLSKQAAKEALEAKDPVRKKELEILAGICKRVPLNPCSSLEEAVNAIWIVWVGLHMENTNAGLSIGRIDQWLQPYFESDMEQLHSEEEKDAYFKKAIELGCCFYMRCTDHLPLVPDLANYLFGGSSSDQAITLGGVTPEGEDAVNDMTYIFLKVTEMLSIRDPNVNARYKLGVNSDMYLKRLCDVNLITAATPSLHSDDAVIKSLAEFNYPQEDLNNWAATGCVEPTLSGKHIGHTNFQMMNMVAALEMAMNNGKHPLMNWKVGPKTGIIKNGDFQTFEDFYVAFTEQFRFLIEHSIEYNNQLGLAHQKIRPTPLLSSMIGGCIDSGSDVTRGGACYNSSGAACIGLADVTDSLMAIKQLVYDDKSIGFNELKTAVDTNYRDNDKLHTLITNKVPLFGSGSDEAVEMANRITKYAHDQYGSHINYRGGKYTVGFWSMSNHVAYGTLTGALPSGRLAGKPFTPGLTPEPHASDSLLDNLRDVARLAPENMNNNIAFNVKIVPGAGDNKCAVIENIFSYVKTFFQLGGMQMQLNILTSKMLKDAMAHPEHYRNLIVRISGYNAYFVTINKDMQLELIERAEYGL